jgi:hypothetical protein
MLLFAGNFQSRRQGGGGDVISGGGGVSSSGGSSGGGDGGRSGGDETAGEEDHDLAPRILTDLSRDVIAMIGGDIRLSCHILNIQNKTVSPVRGIKQCTVYSVQ